MHLDCILRYNFECRFLKQQAKAWSENKNENENENKGPTWKRKWKGGEKNWWNIWFEFNNKLFKACRTYRTYWIWGQCLNIADKTSRWAVCFSALSCISFFCCLVYSFFFPPVNRIESTRSKPSISFESPILIVLKEHIKWNVIRIIAMWCGVRTFWGQLTSW